jgi:hypothetical protein
MCLGSRFGLFVGLSIGPFAALFAWASFGGKACVRHLVLRLALAKNGWAPWNYARFLDYASRKILLNKQGGGYSFIHRLLLEHFARRFDASAYSDSAEATKLSRTEIEV